MRVAIATDNNKCSGHFGHCEGFKIYDVIDKKIEKEDYLINPGHKPGFLPKYLSENNINVIVSSGMGSSAQELFKKANIEVIVGCEGDINEIITNYINGSLVSDKSICDRQDFKGNCND